ncbi:phage virion morphogenesis protein [Paracoccus sp. (in: a-proteobacteria)]|uniref:phage virion morphogenesis protein n=1 Tax=Paracoccus sp. TaxID=267 RepID=UPI0026DF9C41|nr:phage virion morphogenesis protein [Paracoccus sp. (in: a-proteobacteria)]MDO5648861.1 phage virion morphogenesis protein [Paracoccus sp. (in: a-proteobacteria)]
MEPRFDFQDSGLRAQLTAAMRAASDLSPLLEDIGEQMTNSARERIGETNTAPDGTPWPKSFRVTVAQGGKTLYDTGDLYRRITSRVVGQEVHVGSNLPYAAVHQFGATITAKTAKGLSFRLADGTKVLVGSVTIPARPYLGISRDDEEVIGDLVNIHWETVLGNG